ncbi:DUF302 domain-containing protein [Paraburkholderia sp. BL9I2N2]|uniref:DUF302 domain-containing protein n=1 Tax=Paraburkholderia sp. BL9I2N2 TaxID=1938809 RepID=UPI0010E32095|nr:DUF302 domain-containing protein [Paraburkholderia sp. BL9I2N2]TCK84362.1 uncharacterized protein (DUF302 family) [Paraburkholderia sp. BL9I2N2]
MKRLFLTVAVALTHFGGAMSAQATDDGIVTVSSHHSVPETVDRLESLIKARQLTLFAHIDFSSDAQREGLAMQPSQLLVFGNPRAGTPLMQAMPTAALDLPLKVLVWEDAGQRVWMSYNSVDYLQQRHKALSELMKPLSGVAALVSAAAAD